MCLFAVVYYCCVLWTFANFHFVSISSFKRSDIGCVGKIIYYFPICDRNNVYIDVLDDIVNKYNNNTYHRKIQMKPIDVKDNAYIDSSKEVNDKEPKFKVGDHVRISKYKNNFAKGYTQIGLKKFLWFEKFQNTVPWTYVINDLKDEEICGTFGEKELQKANQKEFRMEKVIKKKGDKLYVKLKTYDNSFNRLTDKKVLIN